MYIIPIQNNTGCSKYYCRNYERGYQRADSEKALDSKEESALKSINTNSLNYAIINPLGGF